MPEYYAGKYYGCVTAQLTAAANQSAASSGSMFTIVNRLGYPFELIIDGDLQVDFAFQNFDTDWMDVPAYTTRGAQGIIALLERDREFLAYLVAINQGNISQTVTVS
ncbi:MAG: hypothetical protein H6766_03065 [Candidatus Peribacteria bacterium]|nr:MAG: hypothetical protein H6766_03065 [Candidatus Peribacteria bacterium]